MNEAVPDMRDSGPVPATGGIWSWLSKAALSLAIFSVVFLIVTTVGARAGLWPILDSFRLLKFPIFILALAGAMAAICLVAGFVRRPRRGLSRAITALLISLLGLWVPVSHFLSPRAAIHDITTDTENPPQFVDVLPLRANAPNSADYGGPEVAAIQKKTYPDLGPLHTQQTPDVVISAAQDTARAMGWKIVAYVPDQGRLEATATTRWMGFNDDVIVRVVADGNGSRVDVRSVSRMGKGDLGANAQRVRKFLIHLDDKLK
jgi:uncharacterized protein (DUF1499 family)